MEFRVTDRARTKIEWYLKNSGCDELIPAVIRVQEAGADDTLWKWRLSFYTSEQVEGYVRQIDGMRFAVDPTFEGKLSREKHTLDFADGQFEVTTSETGA